MKTVAMTHERFLALSAPARHCYRHLLLCWLTRGEWVWTRRMIHQDLKGGATFKEVRTLVLVLDELAKAGLVEPLLPLPGKKYGREKGPWFALCQPYIWTGDQPPRVPGGVPAPPPPPKPAAPGAGVAPADGPPTPATTKTQRREPRDEVSVTRPCDREIAWRVESLWRQVVATGKLATFQVRTPAPGGSGCRSCGEPLGPGEDRHCGRCLEALWLVLPRLRHGT